MNSLVVTEAKRTVAVLKEANTKAQALAFVTNDLTPHLKDLKSIDSDLTHLIEQLLDTYNQYSNLVSNIGQGSRVRVEASPEYSEIVTILRRLVRNYCSKAVTSPAFLEALEILNKEDIQLSQFRQTLVELTRLTSAKLLEYNDQLLLLKDDDLSTLLIEHSKLNDEISRLRVDYNRISSEFSTAQKSKDDVLSKLQKSIFDLEQEKQAALSEISKVNAVQRENDLKSHTETVKNLKEERDRLYKQWMAEIDDHNKIENEARTVKLQKQKAAKKWIEDYDDVMTKKQQDYDELNEKFLANRAELERLSEKWNEIDRLKAIEDEKLKIEAEHQQHLRYIRSVIIIQSLWRRHQVLKIHGALVQAAIDKVRPKKKKGKKRKERKKGREEKEKSRCTVSKLFVILSVFLVKSLFHFKFIISVK
ncbi:hypothetical protein GEMRC1_011387 [Eukaryota sp. GEM-RC1]